MGLQFPLPRRIKAAQPPVSAPKVGVRLEGDEHANRIEWDGKA